jgi:serine/threonine protein kinase
VDSNGIPKLCDFGLARFRRELSRTHTRHVEGGSDRHIAPELCGGVHDFRTTPQTDIYSLSMTFLELSTRSHPFQEFAYPRAAAMAAVEGKRPCRITLPDLLPGIADELWNLMECMWVHEPSNRPPARIAVRHIERLQEMAKVSVSSILLRTEVRITAFADPSRFCIKAALETSQAEVVSEPRKRKSSPSRQGRASDSPGLGMDVARHRRPGILESVFTSPRPRPKVKDIPICCDEIGSQNTAMRPSIFVQNLVPPTQPTTLAESTEVLIAKTRLDIMSSPAHSPNMVPVAIRHLRASSTASPMMLSARRVVDQPRVDAMKPALSVGSDPETSNGTGDERSEGEGLGRGIWNHLLWCSTLNIRLVLASYKRSPRGLAQAALARSRRLLQSPFRLPTPTMQRT